MSDETKADKPRGACTGCKFEYQLSTARSGEFKGRMVTRKHNSRTGPGLCDGAGKPPAVTDPSPSGLDLPHDTGAACMHPHGFTWADDGNGHSGSVCLACGAYEPEEESSPVAELRAAGALEPDRVASDRVHDDGRGGIHPGSAEVCFRDGCMGTDRGDRAPAPDAPFVDPSYEPSGAPVPGVDTITFVDPVNTDPNAAGPGSVTVTASALPFTDPAPMPAELTPVSGQPEPDRDHWGRYLIGGTGHTRATTFAKLGSSTYSIQEWQKRMVVKGLTERPDLLALAHGKDVKRDKKELNRIAEDAATHAGNKVAANIGTAYHAFTERLDAGLITLADVPVQYRARCEQYLNAIRSHGLVTRREWIERTTAVRADQVSAPTPVAGTLDRIWQLPNGELVIGDLKTSSNIDYGWAEIAVQLAIYAHGVNTHGLFDWNTKTWQTLERMLQTTGLRVRTDFAIVMHLPADGDGCTLYRIDLVKGWKYAQVSGEVQTRQKDKSVAGVLVPGSLGPVTSPAPHPSDSVPRAGLNPVISGNSVSVLQSIPAAPAAPEATFGEMERALGIVQAEMNPLQLMRLYKYAEESGKFSPGQLKRIFTECHRRWEALNIPY